MLRFRHGNFSLFLSKMTILDTTCPICAAPHAKRLSTIYNEGLSTSTGTMNSVGQFNTIGRQKITTSGTTKGATQTKASLEAAQPEAPSFVSKGMIRRRVIWLWTCLFCILSPLGIAILGWPDFGPHIFFLVLVGGIVYSLTIDSAPLPSEEEEHRLEFAEEYEAHEKWEDTFCCGSCSHRFIPETKAA